MRITSIFWTSATSVLSLHCIAMKCNALHCDCDCTATIFAYQIEKETLNSRWTKNNVDKFNFIASKMQTYIFSYNDDDSNFFFGYFFFVVVQNLFYIIQFNAIPCQFFGRFALCVAKKKMFTSQMSLYEQTKRINSKKKTAEHGANISTKLKQNTKNVLYQNELIL